MKGLVLPLIVLNVRNSSGNLIGVQLKQGDVVYGNVQNNRIYFMKIYRAAGNVQELSAEGNVGVNDGKGVLWMSLTNEEEPSTNPPAVSPIINTIEVIGADGITYTNGAPIVLIPKV